MVLPTRPVSAPEEDIFRSFPSNEYHGQNYQELQAEDKEILGRVSAFFGHVFRARPPVERAIDVGAGTNLYPALLMLPWAERITLTDYADTNIAWLREHIGQERAAWTWDPFWDVLAGIAGYDQVDEPRRRLREKCQGASGVQRRSIFDLPGEDEKWQLGTMFFVAESITADRAVFEQAVRCFIGALEPGAPFAAAFMADSHKYEVGGEVFPATPVTVADVTASLAGRATDFLVKPIEAEPNVREGYSGMIVATGFAAG